MNNYYMTIVKHIAQEADLLIANTHFWKRNGKMDIHNLF